MVGPQGFGWRHWRGSCRIFSGNCDYLIPCKAVTAALQNGTIVRGSQAAAALEFVADGGVVEGAEEGVAEVFGEAFQGRHGVGGGGEAFAFQAAEAGFFHVEER